MMGIIVKFIIKVNESIRKLNVMLVGLYIKSYIERVYLYIYYNFDDMDSRRFQCDVSCTHVNDENRNRIG